MMIDLVIKLSFIILFLNLMGCSDPEESDVPGCMDQSACNHNPDANSNDGSCKYNCPDWVDDPGAYISSATFVGVIIINNEQGEGDVLAAFDSEGDVRGVAIQLIPPFGPHEGEIVYEMQIRSNTEGDMLTFKYYDVSKDIVFDIVENYEFTTNEIMGDVINPVEFNVIPVVSDHLKTLHPFWI